MEDWILNWSAFVTGNTHSVIDGVSYDDGPDWYYKMFESWKKNSDHGVKLSEAEEEERNTIKYTLTKEEVKRLKEWQEHIKAIYGMYGDYVYSFEGSGGLGIIKKVWSNLANAELDLTDIDNW